MKKSEEQSFQNLLSFEFFLGGFFGPSHYVLVDTEEKIIKYGYSRDGQLIDLREPRPALFKMKGVKIKSKALEAEQILVFLNDIEKCKVAFWDDDYNDPNILDGAQWNMTIKYKENEISKGGSNAYPENWRDFLQVLRKFLQEDIH